MQAHLYADAESSTTTLVAADGCLLVGYFGLDLCSIIN